MVRRKIRPQSKAKSFAKKLLTPPPKVRVKKPMTPERYMSKNKIVSNLDSKSVYLRYLQEKERIRELQRVKEMQLSPETEAQLAQIAAIQNKSKTDDYRRQRIRREREIIAKSTSILNTPNIFTDTSIDAAQEIPELNPIRAPNVFKERPDNPHILMPQRLNILQTREAGNELRF